MKTNTYLPARPKHLILALLLCLFGLPLNAQWNTMYTGVNVFDVDPINDSTWYMSEYYVLKKTTNRGASWTTIVPYLTNNNIEEMYFLDENTYWLVGYNNPGSNGWVRYTTDGGITFNTALTPQVNGYLTGVWFTSATTGYVTTFQGKIMKSTNGGATWTNNYMANSEPLRRIKFYNANIGMAVGDNGTALLTTNAGASWTPMALGSSSNVNDVELVTNQLFVLAADDGIHRTTNGGGTWFGLLAQVTERLDFPTLTDGYAGGDGNFYKTTDGGATWLGVNAPPSVYPGYSSVFFTNATRGYAATRLGIWQTTNGVADCPTVNAGPDQYICGNQTMLIATPSANNAYTYVWSPATGLGNPNTDSTVVNNLTPGTFNSTQYVVTMSDPFTGCPNVTDTVVISFDATSFTPNYTQTTNLIPMCAGDSVLITPGSGIATYLWQLMPGNSTSSSVWLHSTDPQITVSITDACGSIYFYAFLPAVQPAFTPNYAQFNNDIIGCTGDNILLDVGAGANSYTWSTLATTQMINVNIADTFFCIVNHCGGTDTYTFNIICDSVWPGDASYDGMADMYDLLNIGTAFGSTGPARTDQSIGWYGHHANAWSNSFVSIGGNYKHADSDGNGTVDYSDTTALILNYGLTHPIVPLVPLGGPNDPPLFFSSIPPNIEEGNAVTIPIYLGSSSIPVTNFYGGAFSVTYDTNFIKPNSVRITFNPSWVGTVGTDAVSICKNLPNSQQVDAAICRNDQNPVSGYGEFAQLHIIMQDDIAAVINNDLFLLAAMMTLSFENEKFIDHQENEFPVNPMPVDISVLTGVDGEPTLQWSVYPNPADEYLMISSPDLQVVSLTITDIQGRQVIRENVNAHSLQQDVRPLIPGMYIVTLQLENEKQVLQKLIIR